MKKKSSPQEYEIVEKDEGVDWLANLVGTLFAVAWHVVILIVTMLSYLVCWAYRRFSKE
jgi:hypothetical protein